MKLYTEISDCGHGDVMVVYNGDLDTTKTCDEQLEHDAMAAHAYKRELANLRKAAEETPRTHERQLVLNLLDVLDRRAAEILAGWLEDRG